MPDVTLYAGAEFPAGSRVTAYHRTGDNWPGDVGGLDVAGTAKSDGLTVVFKDLDAGTYWAAGEGGHKAFSSKKVAAPKKPVPARVGVDRQKVPAAPERVVITGPRGSLVFSHTNVGEQLVESKPGKDDRPQPHVNQFTAGDAVQRSSTVFGQGTPKDLGESQPKDRQEDVPEGVVQASSTEKGEATVLDDQPKAKPRSRAKPKKK